jgi:DNA ligase-4
MPFPFTYVCDLLERLDKNLTSRTGFKTPGTIISDWFRAHQATFARNGNLSGPLLSTLLPEKRTDRVYNLKEKRLQTIIGRALGLGRSRLAELSRWMNPEAGVDLAGCVEMILKETVGCFFFLD